MQQSRQIISGLLVPTFKNNMVSHDLTIVKTNNNMAETSSNEVVNFMNGNKNEEELKTRQMINSDEKENYNTSIIRPKSSNLDLSKEDEKVELEFERIERIESQSSSQFLSCRSKAPTSAVFRSSSFPAPAN